MIINQTHCAICNKKLLIDQTQIGECTNSHYMIFIRDSYIRSIHIKINDHWYIVEKKCYLKVYELYYFISYRPINKSKIINKLPIEHYLKSYFDGLDLQDIINEIQNHLLFG